MRRAKQFTAPGRTTMSWSRLPGNESSEANSLMTHQNSSCSTLVTESHWLTKATSQFVNQNYLSVGYVLVLGKRIASAAGGHLEFEIAIPEKYTVVGRNGEVSGTLDGTEITGPRYLSAGRHDLVLHSPEDSVAIVWSRAIEKGYSPFGQAIQQN